jgi:methionyl-tRNA formyltransferase
MIFIGGNRPRHIWYANRIHEKFPFKYGLLEERKDFNCEPREHAVNLSKSEQDFFGKEVIQFDHTITTDINESDVPEDDLCLVFGCGLIKDPLFSQLPENTINLHLGLSPEYRGSATLFWPFYNKEPNWAGATFHRITDVPDAGDILHQSQPIWRKADTMYDHQNKVIKVATKDMLLLLRYKDYWSFEQQRHAGRNYLSSDYKPEHYENLDHDIMKKYLKGELNCLEPTLRNALENFTPSNDQ